MRRRLLLAALALTAAVAVLDLVGVAWTSRLRDAGAAAFGPILEAVAPRADDLSRTRADLLRAEDALRVARDEADSRADLASLLDSPALRGRALVPARVVGIGAIGTDGVRRVTIDVGSRDGVHADLTVVSVDGLVGRTVRVGTSTSDVALLGAPELAVGVRVGSAGHLGVLGGASRAAHRPGTIGVRLVQQGTLAVGDVVSTLGSPDGRPFVAGVPLGTVTAVDPDSGRLTAAGSVTPAVDVSRLDVVGVILGGARTTPRPSTSGR